MDTRARRLSPLIALLAVLPSLASAFTMEPMSALLSPSGSGTIATFRIKNDGKERIAIRLSLLSRDSSPEGIEVNAPADELFVAYPSRLLVEPGSSASAKVQWRGPPKVDAERSFRLVAEQIALEGGSGKDGNSGIKVMFRYIASLYVGESGFAADLAATVVGAKGPDGSPGLMVELRNQGRRHVIATDARVIVDGLAPLDSAELGGLSGANYLPGRSRRAFVPRPEAVEGMSYQARAEFESAY